MNAISILPQLDNLRIINRIGGRSVENISYAAKQKIHTVVSGLKDRLPWDYPEELNFAVES